MKAHPSPRAARDHDLSATNDNDREAPASAGQARGARAVSSGHDAEAVAALRSQLLNLAMVAEGLSYRELLEAAVDLLWRHDLNREIRGAQAIAEAVYGDRCRQAVARVHKFERDGICTFRRWGPDRTIYLLLGEVMRVRLELQAQGKLP